jgi:hypothetical protein
MQSPSATSSEQFCGTKYNDREFSQSQVLPADPMAAQYAGPGPHPVSVVVPIIDEAGLQNDDTSLPSNWAAADPRHAQLTVCLYLDHGYQGRQVGKCDYFGFGQPDYSLPVKSARYIVRVFETRTGALVKQLTVDGSTKPDLSCPLKSWGSDVIVYQRVEKDDLIAVLRPVVEGKRP